jgi:hypothetical protein
LGWEPKVILSSPIVFLELAIEGKIDFVKKTNPFGSGKEDEEKEEDLLKAPSNPEEAARQLMQFVKKKRDIDARGKSKSPSPVKSKSNLNSKITQ